MKRLVPVLAVALLAAGGLAYAGSFIFANSSNGVDVITHPHGYTGTGGTRNVKVCIDPTSANAADMQISLTNVVRTWNDLEITTGNLRFGGDTNIPTGFIDWESTLLHELGHCIGLAHPNLGVVGGVDADDTNFTNSTRGNDSTYQTGNLAPGTDTIKGSADDQRGDDVNLHWFRMSNNNPLTIAETVDSTTYARATSALTLPEGSSYAANADRDVAAALGFADTEAVMQQGQFTDEAQRSLVADDVATLRYGMSGLDELESTSDDYTINLIDGGISSDSCDITIDFDDAQAGGFALCDVSATTISITDHLRITSAGIFFDTGFNWFFNDELPTPTPTVTPTPTATPTPTPTATPTNTPTNTPGPSPTPTGTATAGPSPTPTGTATAGPSPTPTSTATSTPDPAATATATPTPAACGGIGGNTCPPPQVCVDATLVPNSGTCQDPPTPTPTVTPTASATPTGSATPNPTVTPNPSVTPAVTNTPSVMPTPVGALRVTSGNVTINQEQTALGGVFEITNSAATDLSIGSVTIEISEPTLFASMNLTGEVNGDSQSADAAPPTATTVFTFPAPLDVPPGETATFTLTVTSADGTVAGRVVLYATIVPASGSPWEGAGVLGLFGLLLLAGAGSTPRARRFGTALLLLAIAAVTMAQSACGGGGGGFSGAISEQTIAGVAATSGGEPATIAGVPADLGDIRIRGASAP